MNQTAVKKMLSAKAMLCIALALCLVSMVGASLVMSVGGSVKIVEVSLPTKNGEHLSGYFFYPKLASPENKVPLVVTIHGSFNNKQMQDQNFIELARRGFAVFAADAYGHGNSSINPSLSVENPVGAQAFVQVIDSLSVLVDCIDTEKIAVMGHSMGSMQAGSAIAYYVTQEATGNGPNKIVAALHVGSEPAYENYIAEGMDQTIPITIDYGVIQGKYDEFFFHDESVGGNPARYLESDSARTFINQVGIGLEGPVESGKVYRGDINGNTYLRAIYQSNEIHPFNHFSTQSAGYMVDFFYEALGVPNGYSIIDSDNQIWYWKEILNGIGLLGVFLLIVPLAMVIMKSNFFSELSADSLPPRAPALQTSKDKGVFWGTYILNAAIPALLLIPVTFHLVGRSFWVPNTYNRIFGEPNTNELVGWTIIVGIAIGLVLLVSYNMFGKKNGLSPEGLGIKISVRKLGKTALVALLMLVLIYSIVFFANFFFKVDFRFWILAVQSFTPVKVWYAVVYFPFFFIFYFVNTVSVNGFNRIEGMLDWLVTLISCISNIAGISILIIYQYATAVSTGLFPFNVMRIVNAFPLIVLIPVATIISRRLFNKTGNVYLSALFFGMFYSIMTTSNTMFLASL